MEEKYNGYKNYETWNISLWINNDERLYNAAVDFVKKHKGESLYLPFIKHMGLSRSKTPDGVKYMSNKLSYSELNNVMKDLL